MSLHLAAAVACSVLALLSPTHAQAQLRADFPIHMSESRSSSGFETYAAAATAVHGGRDVLGEQVAGSLGLHLASDIWWWSETPKLSAPDTGGTTELSIWPIFGTRWGVEGGATASGLLSGCMMCSAQQAQASPQLWQGSQWLRLQSGFLNVLQKATYQRSANFNDDYWRAERNLTSLGFGIEMPFFLRYEDDYGLTINFATFSVFGRSLIGESSEAWWNSLELDMGMTMVDVVVEHTYSSFVGRFVDLDVNLFDAPHRAGETPRLIGPFNLELALADMRGISFDDGRHGFGLSGGFRVIRPATLAGSAGLLTDDGEAPGFGPDLKVSFANHQGLTRSWRARNKLWRAFDELTYRLSLGTFYRIGPSGFGVDEGWKLQLSTATPIDDRWSLEATALGVSARRTMIEGVPERDFPDVGSEFLMGRAELGVSRQLGERLILTLDLWGERSDRFDPSPLGFSGVGPAAVRSRFGVAASLATRVF